jgi:hypothetical protein
MLQDKVITSNNETFTESFYNRISIIIRDKDKFVNATRLCSQENKLFRHYIMTAQWSEILQNFNKSLSVRNRMEAIYDISGEFPPNLKGYYIHLNLVHFVAHWCSVPYAFKVANIMDMINE